MTLRHTRNADCLSDLAIDRWLAHELSAATIATQEAHLATCASCAQRFGAAREAQAAFPGTLPDAIAARAEAMGRPVRWRRATAAAGVLAMAALLFLVLRAPSRIDEPGERTKGSDGRIAFFVRHAGAVRLGVEHDRLEPKDGLQFSYTARAPAHLAILSVDGVRHANVYFADGDHAAAVAAGTDVPLPKSTVLDDALGDEVVYALFCETPIAVEPVRAALEAAPAAPPSVAGCTVDRHDFVKVRP